MPQAQVQQAQDQQKQQQRQEEVNKAQVEKHFNEQLNQLQGQLTKHGVNMEETVEKIQKAFNFQNKEDARQLLLTWTWFFSKLGEKSMKEFAEYLNRKDSNTVGTEEFVKDILDGKVGKKAKEALSSIGVTEFQSGAGESFKQGKFWDVYNDAKKMSFEEFYGKYQNADWLPNAMKHLNMNSSKKEDREQYLYWLWSIANISRSEKQIQQPEQQEQQIPQKQQEEKKEEPRKQVEQKMEEVKQQQVKQEVQQVKPEEKKEKQKLSIGEVLENIGKEIEYEQKGKKGKDIIKKTGRVNVSAYFVGVQNFYEKGMFAVYFEGDKEKSALEKANAMKDLIKKELEKEGYKDGEDFLIKVEKAQIKKKDGTIVDGYRLVLSPINK